MDKSAIQQIQTTGNAPEFIKQLANVGFPVAALPENYSLHDLEKFFPERNQFRGVMDTSNIAEFARYHKHQEQEGSQCYIDVDCMSAVTIFDLGTKDKPGHCRNKAKLSLRKTSLFEALLSINGIRQVQKELAEWVEDYADNIQVFTSAGEVIDAPVASAAIRNMKFEVKAGRESSVDDFSQHQSEYESMAVRTKDEFPMPAVFKFTCIPYIGLEERTFEMRMSTIGNEVLILRIKKLEEHMEEMGVQFKDNVQIQLHEHETDVYTFIGSFSS